MSTDNPTIDTTEPAPTPQKEDAPKSGKLKTHFKHNILFYIVIVLLLGVNLYQWISSSFVEKQHSKEIANLETTFQQEAILELFKNSEEQLTLMMKTFTWAVRSSMMRQNNDEIEQYFNNLVQKDAVQEVILVDATGKILVSTNKKHETQSFKEVFPKVQIDQSKIVFEQLGKKYRLIAPVLSLDQRLGTLIVECEATIFQLSPKGTIPAQ